ncbi:MAG: class I SAM-dependent methyltransferase [Acidobacteria bacterium]|nr:class I SAM-dependent methyltransferase [Acidobacteriota bacterium]
MTAGAGAGPRRLTLDAGCGTGQSRQVYQGRSSRYLGVDLSLGALRLARARFPASWWLQADACRLPFGAGAFDLVAFSSVLHHLGDRRAALAEALRILRPGGFVFAFDPNLLHPAMAVFRHPRSPLYRAAGVSPDERPLLGSALRRDLRQAGFAGIGQRCQSDIPYRAVAPRGLDALLPLYNLADRFWEKAGLGRWFGAFVVTWARKP